MHVNNDNIENRKSIYIKIKIFTFIYAFYFVYSLSKLNIQDSQINFFKRFIKHCQKFRQFIPTIKKKNKSPFFSICISLFNAEKFLEHSLLSILYQSFKNFEIIIVNDNSQDNSETIIKRFQMNNPNIKLINHQNNLGIYSTRVDSILNSIGKYILFLDPDDLFLNPYLFERLYKINIDKYLDITEFTVYQGYDNQNNISFSDLHTKNHYHNYTKDIIFQPELTNLLFFKPNSQNFSHVFCRCIWNKMVKRNILNNTINFIGKKIYLQRHFNFAEDTIMNIINFHFANNYSNINIPGYLYNMRNGTASIINNGEKKKKLMINYNIVLYFQILNIYIKKFKKNKNYLFEETKFMTNFFYIKEFDDKELSDEIIKFFSKKEQNSIIKLVNKLRQSKADLIKKV